MATLNPQTEAQSLVDRLKADAADPVEARASLFFAASVLGQAAQQAMQQAEELKAECILEKRAARSGKTAADLKAEFANLTKRHVSTVTAVEVAEAVVFARDAKPDEPTGSPNGAPSGGTKR